MPNSDTETKAEPAVQSNTETAPTETLAERRAVSTTPAPITTSADHDGREAVATTPEEKSASPVTSPGRMKNWLKSKFAKRGSKSGGDVPVVENGLPAEKGFIGGTALTGATANESTGSLSMRDVAMAGKGKDAVASPTQAQRAESPSNVDYVSSLESEDEFQEARDNFGEGLAPQPQFPAEKAHSPARDSKFIEEI